jgi:hypothetical protein
METVATTAGTTPPVNKAEMETPHTAAMVIKPLRGYWTARRSTSVWPLSPDHRRYGHAQWQPPCPLPLNNGNIMDSRKGGAAGAAALAREALFDGWQHFALTWPDNVPSTALSTRRLAYTFPSARQLLLARPRKE